MADQKPSKKLENDIKKKSDKDSLDEQILDQIQKSEMPKETNGLSWDV